MASSPLPLTGGAYTAKALNAGAQRCINNYLEEILKSSGPPMPTASYVRPGKEWLSDPAVNGAGTLGRARGLYTASNGQLFAVVNDGVFFINQAWVWYRIGTISPGNNPTSMADNGQSVGNRIALVDGTPTGYQIDMTTYAFSPIVDPTDLFQGADVVRYLQTFFLFNTAPNSQNWIISQPNSLTFDALDIAAKASYPDNVSWLETRQREVWLLGNIQSTEPWNLAGAVDFPFEPIPATYVSVGLLAKYSVVNTDNALYWLSRNAQGKAIFGRSKGYDFERISTHAIENELQGYPELTDAVGTSFQIEGHTFVIWSFPTANKTWCFDLSTGQWCQFAWTDSDGVFNRDRALFYTQAYGSTVALDWETGSLYRIDPDIFVDQVRRDGVTYDDAIACVRGLPHILQNLQRVTIPGVRVNMECGTILDPNAPMPELGLRISKDAGHTWPVVRTQPLGKTGQYGNTPLFTRLGQARDWVLEFFWSANMKTAMLGVYIVDPEASDS